MMAKSGPATLKEVAAEEGAVTARTCPGATEGAGPATTAQLDVVPALSTALDLRRMLQTFLPRSVLTVPLSAQVLATRTARGARALAPEPMEASSLRRLPSAPTSCTPSPRYILGSVAALAVSDD